MTETYLLPYQDIPRSCIKCGMDGDIGILTKYMKGTNKKEPSEYLIRTCSVCGYFWITKTKS